MHEQWQEQIPFYVAGTLSADEAAALEQHLTGCAECRRDVDEWRTIADATWREANAWSKPLPPLSAAVRDHLTRKPTYSNGYKETGLEADPEYSVVYLRPERKPKNQRANRSLLTLAAALFMVVVLGGIVLLMLSQNTFEPESAYLSSGNSVETIQQPEQDRDTPTRRPSPTAVTFATSTSSDLGILPVASPTRPLVTESFPPTVNVNRSSATATPYTPPGDSQCFAVSGSNATALLYAGPGAEYTVLNNLITNESVAVLARSDNNWYQVDLLIWQSHWIGWLQSDKVTLTGQCNNLPVKTSAGYPAETAPQISVTPTAQFLNNAFGQYVLVIVEDIGPFKANTYVRVNQAYYNHSEWIYGVEAQDGTQADVPERYVRYVDGYNPYQPTPTAMFHYDIGMNVYSAALTEDYGLFQAGALVKISTAYYDGSRWMYTVIAQDGVTYAEIPQSKLTYAPDYGPGPHPTATSTPLATPVVATVEAAYQPFQNGYMIWRGDTGDVYALSDSGQVFRYSQPVYEARPDNPVTDSPPAGMFKPISGFGRVWGNYKSVRDALGWGLSAESGYNATLTTNIDNIIIKLPDGRLAQINNNSTWLFVG